MAVLRLIAVLLAAFAAMLISSAAPSRAGEPPPQPLTQHDVACPPLPDGALVQPLLALQLLPASQAQCAPQVSLGDEVFAAGLSRGGISGRITEEGTGLPLEGACAIVFDSLGRMAEMRTTDENGDYVIPRVLHAGNYRVWFVNCDAPGAHRSQWYSSADDIFSADRVRVEADLTTANIDAGLVAGGGEINGLVTEQPSGEPLPDVCVVAYDGDFMPRGLGVSAVDGSYRLAGLPGDSYTLFFSNCEDPQQHVAEYYDGHAHPADANTVPVTEGSKTGSINAALAHGASVNGYVSSMSDGFELWEICVAVYDLEGNLRGFAVTDVFGEYAVGGLEGGLHRVFFFDCTSPRHHISEWYNNQSAFASATAVSVGAPGSKRSGVDAVLAEGGSIDGAVAPAGTLEALPLICVEVWTSGGRLAGTAVSDLDGAFEAGGFVPGTYKVRFWDCRDMPQFVSVWYNNQPNFERATPLRVDRLRTVGASAILSRGGLINGTIRDAETNTGLTDGCSQAYDSSGELRAFTVTDAAGRYTMVLPTGQFRVVFFYCLEEPRYNPQWYNQRNFFETATPISVGSAGSKRSGINGALRLYLAGDVDCDNVRTSIDAALVLQGVAGLLSELPCIYNSDVDDDGYFSAIDAALILQYVAGLLSSL